MIKLKKGLSLVLSTLVLVTTVSLANALSVKADTQSKDASINGDWSATYVQLYDTEETEVMVRVGDIDNFGYGWSEGFDPFTGKETAVHPYPFYPSSKDPDGTDRIMVVSGYDKKSNAATDGYTSDTSDISSSYNSKLVPITLTYDLKGKKVDNAVIQIFIDDIQPSKWKKSDNKWRNDGRGGFSQNSLNQYQVTFCVAGQKPVRIPEFEAVINNLDQHGPIGKLVTFTVPEKYLSMIQQGEKGFQIKIDDPNKKAPVKDTNKPNTGDGYAIDFVKLMINKNSEYTKYNATVKGKVYEAKYVDSELKLDRTKPIANAKIKINGSDDNFVFSDSTGAYISHKVPAGQVVLNVEKDGYEAASFTIGTLEAGQELNYDIGLVKTDKPLTPSISLNTYTAAESVIVTIDYPGEVTKKLYRIDNGAWVNYTGPFTISSNSLIEAMSVKTVKVNSKQTKDINSDICSLQVTNIIPPAPILIPDTTEPVNRDVNVTIKYPDGQVIKEVMVKLGSNDWKTYDKSNIPTKLVIDKPMKIEVKYKNGNDIWSNPGILNVDNIDKESPTGRVIVTYSGNKATLDLKIDNDEVVDIIPTVGEYTHNGKTYKIVGNGIFNAETNEQIGTIQPGGRQVIFYANGKYTFRFKDRAGNIGMATGIADMGADTPLDPDGRQER